MLERWRFWIDITPFRFKLIAVILIQVLDCLFEKARFYSKIGDVENAFVAYDTILSRDKTTTGKKIDASMEKARVALFQMVNIFQMKPCNADCCY